MSVEAFTWALNLAPVPMDSSGKSVKPNSACAFVLTGLANHAEPDGRNAFPGVSTLVRYTRLSERTVRTALDRLEELGVITPSDPAVIAAKIKRADQRPKGFDLNMEMVREDLSDPEMDKIGRSYPWLRPWIDQHRAQRGAVIAPRERGAAVAPRDERGATGDTDGVQPTQQRGAAVAPETSLEPSSEPSTTTPTADAAVADGVLPGLPDDVPSITNRAHAEALTKAWHDHYVGEHGPIVSWRHVAVRNQIEGALNAGYAENEIKRALKGLATPMPSQASFQNALSAVRSGRPVTRGGKTEPSNVHHADTGSTNERKRSW